MLFGRSCVIGRDGTILADAGHEVGLATAEVDLDKPRLVEGLDTFRGEGLIRDRRKQILEDRRPELYRLICDTEADEF
jgi:predicted amidohydrolase